MKQNYMSFLNRLKKTGLTFFSFTVLSSNLSAQAIPELLYYKFDGTGTSVPNLASAPPAGTINATIMGGITQGTGSGSGQCHGALIGSGNASSTDYLNTGFAPNLGAASWTISMWTSNITPSATLFYIFGDANSASFRCFTNGVAGANNWIIRGAGLTDTYINGGATVAPHVTTFVYDAAAANMYAYLDGVLVSTVAQGAVNLTGTGPFKVMGYATNVGSPAGGLVDEFRMYSRALSAAEVLELAGAPDVTSSISVANCLNYTVPSGDSTYTVSGTYMDTIPAVGGCADSIITINLTVNSLPTVNANATSTAICNGEAETLTGSGATSYTWAASTSVTDGVVFNPSSTDTYTVTGTDANGCSSTDMVTVTVNSLPTVVANTTTTTVCNGDPVTLTGSGATSYTWAGSVTVNDGVAFNPSSTDTYTVTGTDANGCMNTDMVTVTVNSLPTVAANTTTTTVCNGDPVTLTGSGAASYAWTGSVTNNVAFNPSSTNTYTVTGTDANGCMNTDMVTVTVNSLPTVTLTLSQNTICITDAAITLSGESPAGGSWSGTGIMGSSFDPSMSGAGTFPITYSYTDLNGCSASAGDNMVVDVCTGISSVSSGNVSVFPNPNNGNFTIKSSTETVYTLIDEVGQTVQSFKLNSSNNYSKSFEGLNNGVYFIVGYDKNRVVKQKIVVTR